MTRTVSCVLVGLCLMAACGAKTPPPPETTAGGAAAAEPDAAPREERTCQSNADCGAAEICFGPEGCTTAWTCVPMRACTRDLVIFCGCDGRTRQGSGSCPPGPYKRRGACEE